MTDSPAGGEIRACADAASLSRIEGSYREHCEPISDICIVPLAAHLHAIIVPNFELLREQHRPNSREHLRFEFHEASKQLPAGERPDTFSLRSTPLPRAADGEPDRERLSRELSEEPRTTEEALAMPSGPTADRIGKLIRLFRPDAVCEANANLELNLGFDSLDRVLLIASIEKAFGIVIPDDQAARIFTVSDLISAVEQRAPSSAPAAVSWSEALRQPLVGAEQSLADSILKQRPGLTLLAWGIARLLRLVWGRRFRFEVHGREWILPAGPYLLVANHTSHLDPLVLLWALPYRVARRVSFMGHTEYFGSGWKAAIATRLKLVPVDPDEHARSGMRLSADALRRGMIGMVFPEGERSPNGVQQRFHRGVAVLAREIDVPILPVAICGTYEVLPRGREQIRSAPVQVRFGPPLRPDPQETEQNLLARMWAAVRQLREKDARPRESIPAPLDIYSNRMG
ncbi:MAG TPA: 1-acyl-sn-glycerol-3-phosphate acyltransferase [Acidobacteriaceae bacterium]|nr:1-acyl-sn-glycerol-3-phosphate acyltransferase [Acidobacteriaceae bacterium]